MKRLFTALCALMAIFLSISGWASVQSLDGAIFQIIFMPVTLYLSVAAISPPEISFSQKKTAVTVSTMLFVVLAGLTLLRIFNL